MNFIVLLLASAFQTPPPPPAPPTIDCSDGDHRAFDFWIGDWDVSPTTPSSIVIARSRIEKIVGCAISETYDQDRGPKGRPVDYHGRSISTYVPEEKNWRQFYVDNGGTVAMLTGRVVDGAMVFTSKKGTTTTRMTLKSNPDGSVRQHGETTDDEKTWSPSFDLTYRRHAATP